MRDIDTLFDELGGPAAVETETGITANHVRQMKLRRSIPVRHWPKLIDAAKRKGVTLTEADLLSMNVPSVDQDVVAL